MWTQLSPQRIVKSTELTIALSNPELTTLMQEQKGPFQQLQRIKQITGLSNIPI